MLKRIAAVLGVVLLSAACGTPSNDNNSESTDTTSSVSVRSSSRTKSFCDDMASEIGDLFTEYAEALEYASASDASLAVSVGHKLVDVGRTWIDQCGHFYPSSKVNTVSDNLDDLERTLNGLS